MTLIKRPIKNRNQKQSISWRLCLQFRDTCSDSVAAVAAAAEKALAVILWKP